MRQQRLVEEPTEAPLPEAAREHDYAMRIRPDDLADGAARGGKDDAVPSQADVHIKQRQGKSGQRLIAAANPPRLSL